MPSRFKFGGSLFGGNLIAIVLLIVSLVCTFGYAAEDEGGPLHKLQDGFNSLSTPFQIVGSGIGAAGNSASDAAQNITTDANTVSELKQQNEELRNYVSQLEEYRQEAKRLQKLLDLKDSYSMDSVTCRVIGKSSDAWSRTITLDQGSDSGVEVGMPVCASTGLVGQVTSVTPSTSEVRLIEDSQSGVAVLVQSNRAQGLLRGSLDGLLYLEDVDADKKVKVGDVIITSGSGGSYLRGLLVGTVVKVEETDGASNRTIVVSPNADADSLEEVMVVKKMGTDGALSDDSSSSSSSSE
ncbi:MAG: rod shape-determining protein MreC [Eggerthellaceae bacterium]|jgi:rod shape-determining protein MreC